MRSSLRRLFKPFERDYVRYLTGVFLKQTLLVGSGYSMVLALRLCMRNSAISEWVFIGLFLLYDAGLLSLDVGLNWFFSSRLGYPLFGKLRAAALAKVLEMPIEWHHRKESGRLAGEVNTGVGKVVQTAESVSRELVPAVMRTVLSLLPLLAISAWTVPASLAALGAFLWLSILENRKKGAVPAEPLSQLQPGSWNVFRVRAAGAPRSSVRADSPAARNLRSGAGRHRPGGH